MKCFSAIVFLLFFSVQLSYAQNEIARERSSLTGIKEMGVVVNIEKPIGLVNPSLDVTWVRQQIVESFEDLPVRILDDKILKQSDEFPILHVHVNIMRASNLTLPFSIELNFYQPVKLVLNRDLKTMAITWNKGQVGLVSENMIPIIVEEAVALSSLFKDAFEEVNL
ncbi:MAG: hypothetical protein ED557_08720 [Balneola sp.]|nr:MAG: hypothetical protein ED557_08720 [Balneola sp.]